MRGEATDGERFVGSLTARGRDYGPIDMRSSSGVECNGAWQFNSQGSGSASFTCADGRIGTAELAAGDAAAGTMKGMLGGKPFAGTFERARSSSNRALRTQCFSDLSRLALTSCWPEDACFHEVQLCTLTPSPTHRR